QAGEGDLLEAVPFREVAEGGVARDDLVAAARAETVPELAVQQAEAALEADGLPPSVESVPDRHRHPREADGIEPDVRVEGGLSPCRRRSESLPGEEVERRAVAARDRLLEGRLEPLP